MTYYKKYDAVKREFESRQADAVARLEAWEKVTINPKHKVLTNRAVDGAQVRDYLNINKALYVHYRIGHQYKADELTIFSYNDENGKELGTAGFVSISRTLTPREAAARLADSVEQQRQYVADLREDAENLEAAHKAYEAAQREAERIQRTLKTGAAQGALTK